MTTPNAGIIQEIERRRFYLSLGLLKVYNYYRVLVGLALLSVFLQTLIGTRLGTLVPQLFATVVFSYIFLNLASTLVVQLIPRRFVGVQTISFALVAFDIFALTWMMYLSGGVGSGLGVLILVAVATGAIIVTGRASRLLPALGTIAVLFEEFYLSLSAPQLHDYFQAGVLGVLYFAFFVAIQNLSDRIRRRDIQALTQAVELSDLERVNRQIIHRMRTGIVLVDHDNVVRMVNQSALALIGQVQHHELEELPENLVKHLNAWRQDIYLRIPPFQIGPGTPQIRVSFSAVRSDNQAGDVTIFIEDTGELQQQAQQLKLAALGRLSASIAHEIRNPLGAISHAAQLLSESDNLEKGDARLTDIIHSHCIRMNDVIENVLEMPRRTQPSPVRLCLASYLDEFAQGFKESMTDAIIEVKVEPKSTEVRIDRSQLSQVLTNLVGNGIRYSKEHNNECYVFLEGGIDPRTDRPYLNVIDHGPGVPEDQVVNLFEPFFTTAQSGTGLGLYISRELCEANQAGLSYFPHDDGGSCFRITFTHPDRITG
ncbi:MAG: HAMP domain-containing histidine kinase [Gammaproteobacteria bacterium]|nr:MAG: HAMP domain-containing histidine kinase [Gammaproteobacteria bacterium]